MGLWENRTIRLWAQCNVGINWIWYLGNLRPWGLWPRDFGTMGLLAHCTLKQWHCSTIRLWLGPWDHGTSWTEDFGTLGLLDHEPWDFGTLALEDMVVYDFCTLEPWELVTIRIRDQGTLEPWDYWANLLWDNFTPIDTKWTQMNPIDPVWPCLTHVWLLYQRP